MSRQPRTKPANLTINATPDLLVGNGENTPPLPSASSPMNLEGIDLSSFGGDFSAPLMTIPSLPQSPPASPRVNRDNSKTFLNSFKTRATAEQEQRAEPPPRRPAKDDDDFRPSSSSVSKIYHLRKNPGSTPELSLVGSAEGDRKHSDDGSTTPTPENKPQPPLPPIEDTSGTKRREKGFRINPLARTKSTRRDSNSKSKPDKQLFENPPKTAPLRSDWHGSSEMLLKPRGKEKRGKSAERAVVSESEDNLPLDKQQSKEKDRRAFVTGSKNVMNKAKTGGGHLLNKLGKLGRTGSNHEKELPDSEYVVKVINLPLIEQTRVTRISKDLGSCRDKTEYWMPSLPWRCIDYLNLNCESEGLYRVPGSGPQVKHWQRRFDTELDLDLLDEEELYDPNIVSSMLKSWLRDLPTEIMPKTQQAALAEVLQKENPNYQRVGEEAPQELRDALSRLPPFNYYLLFAITCHLSLLLSHKDKNKMDLNNLSICIGPCLDLDRWLFNYLVGDWRRCWQGCYTEKQFLEAEKAFEQGSEYEMPVAAEKEQVDEQSSQVAATEEKDMSTASRNGSRQQNRDDAGEKSALDEKASPPLPSPPLPSSNENLKPETSLSSLPDYSLYVNGAVLPTPERPERKASLLPFDSQRPSTAQATESPKIGMLGTLKPKAPPHTRSQSDLPLSPSLPASPAPAPADFPFKVRNEWVGE